MPTRKVPEADEDGRLGTMPQGATIFAITAIGYPGIFFSWIYCIQRANSSIKERYKALKRKRAVVVDLGVNLLQKQNEMIEGMKIITGQ